MSIAFDMSAISPYLTYRCKGRNYAAAGFHPPELKERSTRLYETMPTSEATRQAAAGGINPLTTLKGSLLEDFFPAAWDLERWDACVADDPQAVFERQDHWHEGFQPRMAEDIADFNVMLGHELAAEIRRCREAGRRLALILPVGPMGMYRWAGYFLREWDVLCDHVTGFNMDEWSDAEGNTLDGGDPRSFQNAMEAAFYGRLGPSTVPPDQRFFATKERLPEYLKRIAALRAEGAKLVVVYGIGRVCHIAFWVTLRHPVTRHIPSTWLPTRPGVLVFTRALAGPLEAEAN